MNIEAEKELIKRQIDEINDSEILESIRHLLHPVKPNDVKPMSIEDYRLMIEESERDVAEGKIYRHEDVMREIID